MSRRSGNRSCPLVDRCGTHDDEGVHNVEVVIGGLRPEWAVQGVRRKAVVGGKEEERDQYPG